MRIVSSLRISKKVSSVLNAAVVAGLILAPMTRARSEVHMGDMGKFIEEHAMTLTPVPKDMALEDLGAFIETLPEDSVPVLVLPKHQTDERLSDGNFNALSVKWKRGVMQVISEGRCKKYEQVFVQKSLVSPMLQKAHAIVESNCNAGVVGTSGELGIYQVMPKTCHALGVDGDYTNSGVNARCTEQYRKLACSTVKGKCTATFMFISHNRGIKGAERVSNLYSLEYARKIHYAVNALLGMFRV